MKQRLFSLVDWTRRHYRHARGERMLLTTFWPQDYWRGAVYMVGRHPYRITRYVHAADPRFFEVWGRAIPHAAPDQSPRRPMPGSTRATSR